MHGSLGLLEPDLVLGAKCLLSKMLGSFARARPGLVLGTEGHLALTERVCLRASFGELTTDLG